MAALDASIDVGELDLFAIRAGEIGVPIGLVSGDQILDEPTIRIQTPDMDWRFRRVAYLGYGNRAGVTRH
jgi:D-aminopeptidase